MRFILGPLLVGISVAVITPDVDSWRTVAGSALLAVAIHIYQPENDQ